MLKRVISLVVGVACLMSMTSAFAAMTYDATTTEYYANNQIKVTSTVTGAAGDTATYLVYNKDLADATAITQGSDIIYVDQYKFTGSETGDKWTFSYVTDSANIGSKIKVGNGATSGATAPATIPGITYPVTVKTSETTWGTYAYTDAAEYSWYKIPFATSQSIVESVEVNGAELSTEKWFTSVDALWLADDAGLKKDGKDEITVVVEDAQLSAKTISMAYFDGTEETEANGYDAIDDANNEDYQKSVVAVGQVTGNCGDFGIIIGESVEAIKNCLEAMNAEGSAYTGANAFKPERISASALPSLGKNSEGKFAIRVYDDGLTGDVYAATYYKGTSGYALSGNYRTLAIGQ